MARWRWRAGSVVATALAIATTVAAMTLAAAGGSEREATATAKPKNPCLDPERRREKRLRCPDLRMRPPFGIERERENGRPVLRAANSIDSVGDGPAELRGRRSGARTMKAKQRIHKLGGGHANFKTSAELLFKHIPGQGPYWKFRHAARFELWLLDPRGERKRMIADGPKQVYCLRDLKHTHRELPRSPDRPVYPSCSQDPGERRVTVGTSVGWSDVYPTDYHEQFISLERVPKRGCYAYVHVADPQNGILERNEDNNEASTVVYLTKSGKYLERRCDGVRDTALPASQTGDDGDVPAEGGGAYGA